MYRSGLIFLASLAMVSISSTAPVMLDVIITLKRQVSLSTSFTTSSGRIVPVTGSVWATLSSLPYFSAGMAQPSKAEGCSKAVVTTLVPGTFAIITSDTSKRIMEAVMEVAMQPPSALNMVETSLQA